MPSLSLSLVRIFKTRFELRNAARSAAQHDVSSQQLSHSRRKRLQTRSRALADSGLPKPDIRRMKQRFWNHKSLVRELEHLLTGVDFLTRFLPFKKGEKWKPARIPWRKSHNRGERRLSESEWDAFCSSPSLHCRDRAKRPRNTSRER